MARNGATALVYVNTGTSITPVYTLVGEQRDLSIDKSTGEIDASTKSNTDQVVIGGRNSATLTLDALKVPDDAGQLALEAAQEAGDLILIEQQVGGVATRKANFLITSISEGDPDQDVSTFSVSMTRSGSWLALT